MDTCIYCHADSVFSICDDCDLSNAGDSFASFVDISDSAAPRAKRTNRWYSPATFFSGPSIVDATVTL